MSFPVATISRPAIVPLRAIWSTGPGTWMMSAWTLPVAVVPAMLTPFQSKLPWKDVAAGSGPRFTLQSNSLASYPGKWTEASIENRRQSCHLHYPGVLAHVIVVLRGSFCEHYGDYHVTARRRQTDAT